jgi:inorganic pyrophosphatase
MGAAPNIILGLALGYMSTIIPILCLAVTIYISFTFAGMYGIALAALGMLGCLPIALAIDGYGPISDNAGGIAEMSHLHKSVREATDKLDAAGNTTAAIGKGFAIGSACLVALALFGAFVTRTGISSVNILSPLEFSGLLVGAMLPYAFSALTMSAVGQAANEMIKEISD